MRSRLAHGHDGDPQRLRHHLRRRHADAQAGEQAGPDVDRDGGQLLEADTGPAHELTDGGGQLLGVPPAACDPHLAAHLTAVADGDADVAGGGVEREQQHQAVERKARLEVAGACVPPWAFRARR